jgi:hypothetical protein
MKNAVPFYFSVKELSPSIYKFGNEFIHSGLSAEYAKTAQYFGKYVSVIANRISKPTKAGRWLNG